jgi:hypothetical protein
VAAVGLCTLVAGLLPGVARTAAREEAPPVVVTLANAKVSLSKTSIPVGPIVFSVTNKASSARTVTVAGKRTGPIAPGKKATLRVAFDEGGRYVLVSAGAKTSARTTLRVTSLVTLPAATPSASPPPASAAASCRDPVATTVTVSMHDGFFTLSHTSIPCGTVTFVTTNVGTLEHSLMLGSGQRPGLNAGETRTFTVNLTPGDVHWECGTFGHDDLGEEGTLVIF